VADDFNPGAIRAKLTRARGRGGDGANRGLKLGAEHLLKSARDIVPIEEGTLETSGQVSVDTSGFRAAVSFNTPYAVVQHEDLTMKHDPGRRAKYLEGPMNTEAATIAALVGAEVKKELGL